MKPILDPIAANGAAAEPAIWELSFQPAGGSESAWRARLVEQARTQLLRHLQTNPAAREVTLETPLCRVQLRCQGEILPGAPLKLVCREPLPSSPSPAAHRKEDALPVLSLPDEATHRLGKQLVGLDAIRDDVLLRLHCLWDGWLDAHTNVPVTPALLAHLGRSVPLFQFAGDPGTGKSALARVIADTYCRAVGCAGAIHFLTTNERGNGLVGDFSQRLRAAFAQLTQAPDDHFRLLLVDEADALAVRRSEANSHQEDRAATASILQCVDALAGQRRVALVLTTNLSEAVDAALRRRAISYAFPRPSREARQALLTPWLPHFKPRELERAARLAAGMTPADIERTLVQTTLTALRAEGGLAPRVVCRALMQGERTGRV